jgi:hypothetical protein
MKYCPHYEEVNKFLKGTSQPAVLTDPFPTHQQQMVGKNLSPLQGGNIGHSHHGDASSSVSQVFMCKDMVRIMTREKTYDTPLDNHANGGVTYKPSTSTPPYSTPLHIENLVVESVLCPPKGTIRKSIFNPSARAAKKYNIIEYLVQALCAMSTLEVLQSCPSQRRTPLSTIEVVDLEAPNMIMFNMDYFKLRLSHHLTFKIQSMVGVKNIHRIVLDERASTYVMSLSNWRVIGSLEITSILPPLRYLMDMVSKLVDY